MFGKDADWVFAKYWVELKFGTFIRARKVCIAFGLLYCRFCTSSLIFTTRRTLGLSDEHYTSSAVYKLGAFGKTV